MNTESKRLITYIKEMNLGLSDFLLMFGFLFSIPFYAFAWKFMVTWDPSEIFLDTRMIITCFAITIICWAGYFFLEIKNGRIKFNLFTCIYIIMAIMSVVIVLIQKNVNTFYVECKREFYSPDLYYPGTEAGDIVEVVSTLTPVHKLFFACASFIITTIFYIILVVLPKRIKNMKFLVIIAVITMIFMFGMCVYSYIAEANKYAPFIKAFIEGDAAQLKDYAMSSFVVMSVPYGVCMMLAFLFAILSHTITKKAYWYIPAIFFLLNMLFSYCRTSIAISYILFITYIIFRLVVTFKSHIIRNSILASFLGLLIITFIVLFVMCYIKQGDFLPYLFAHIKNFADRRTFITRKNIWGNIRNELKGGWIVIGRGFGAHNYMLYPMNLVNNDNVCPSHSTFYAILGAGGIITLIAFFGLLAYYVVIFIKTLKYNKTMPIMLSAGLLAYLAYSFSEGVNYLVVVFTFPLILYYHIESKKTI